MALIDVISYEGGNEVLVCKYPHTEFNTLSQPVVHEAQEAIFFCDGKMLDTFGPGRYTMHTGNIPLLNKLINLPSGGVSPFRCEVYFINRALSLNHKWGTSSQARVLDQAFNLLLTIGASGSMGLNVKDPRKLMVRIVGTETQLTGEQCMNYFLENMTMKIKEYIARVMKRPKMNFMVLDESLSDFSTAVKEQLNADFEDVGVQIYNFVISTVKIPDEQFDVITQGLRQLQAANYEQQRKVIEAKGNRESMRIDTLGEAERMGMLSEAESKRSILEGQTAAAVRLAQGYNWADEHKAEIAKTNAASGAAQSNPASLLAGAPMAMAFGNMLRDNIEPMMDGLFAAICHITAFALIKPRQLVFWPTYLLTLFAFCVVAALFFLPKLQATAHPVTGLSLLMVSGVYLAIQVAVSLLLILLPVVGIKAVLLSELLLLSVYLMLALSTLFAGRVLGNQQQQQREKVSYLRSLADFVRGTAQHCSDVALQKRLLQMSETNELSDSMSQPELAPLEDSTAKRHSNYLYKSQIQKLPLVCVPA